MKISIFGFQHIFRDNHLENAPEEGVHPQIFMSTLQIHIIWALRIQKIDMFIHINTVGVNEGPA